MLIILNTFYNHLLGDVEDSSPCTSAGGSASSSVASQLPAAWSREATELLINLYEENENEMEDPRHI